MMTKRILVVALSIVSLLITSCSSDDGPPTSNLTLELIGLEPLTGGASYEAWLVVDGEPVSINKFSSVGTTTVFPVVTTTLESATEFFLSIEAPNDADPKPSKTRILTGTFTGSVAQVVSTTVMADFSSVSGKFVMATPTDNVSDNDEFGIWFEDPSGIQVAPGLDLPPLADGWKYEGWVVLTKNGTSFPVSTGTFSDETTFDDASPYSGNGNAPDYPGEDFINSAPQGLTFPEDGDVRGKMVVISVEPSPDYDQATPFFIKPLTGTAQQNVAPAINTLTANNNVPFGRVVR